MVDVMLTTCNQCTNHTHTALDRICLVAATDCVLTNRSTGTFFHGKFSLVLLFLCPHEVFGKTIWVCFFEIPRPRHPVFEKRLFIEVNEEGVVSCWVQDV